MNYDDFFGTAEKLADIFDAGKVGFWRDEKSIYHHALKGASTVVCGKPARHEPNTGWKEFLPAGKLVPFCTDCLNKALAEIKKEDG